MSRADSRVRQPGSFTCAGCPAVRSALDAGLEAYHYPAAVWWGAFAASPVIRDQVVTITPEDRLAQKNGVWGAPRRVREGRRACACGVITQGGAAPGTGVRGGSPGGRKAESNHRPIVCFSDRTFPKSPRDVRAWLGAAER